MKYFYKHILREDRGISDYVAPIAGVIKNNILAKIEEYKNGTRPMMHNKTGDLDWDWIDFSTKCFGKTLKSKCFFFNIKDEKKFMQYKYAIKKDYKNLYNPRNNTIYLCLIAVNFNLTGHPIDDVLYHEVFHMVKTQLKPGGKNRKERRLYWAHFSLNDPTLPHGKEFSTALYFSDQEEQQAFCNGNYNNICSIIEKIQTRPISPDYIKRLVYSSDLHSRILHFKIIIEKLSQLRQDYDGYMIKDNTGLTYDQFMKYIRQAYDRYTRYFGKLMSKLIDEYTEPTNKQDYLNNRITQKGNKL